MDRKPSEIIQDFIWLMESSHSKYLDAKQKVEEYDQKTLDWVHRIENSEKAEERSKISTAWHKERKERRKYKNEMALYEKIHKFSIDEQNKPSLKRLKTTLQRQIETEEYLQSGNKILKSKKVIEK